VRLASREQHAFSAFADAVASALHDAATHRQLRVATARSAYEAVHDRLTGLADRSTLLARGNAELRRLDPSSPVGLLLFDVDGFRAVNDALGHAAGDQLLRVLARRLGAMYVDGDLVGRLGGDTFALVCTGVPDGSIDEGHAACVLDRARLMTAVLARPAMISGVTIAVEVSAGIAVEAAGRCDITELLRRAEVALHHARRAGARIAQYDATCDATSTDRLTVLAELRDALATTDQLTVLLQPSIDLSSGAPTGAEALTRWQHPRRGMLVPAAFIDVIEQSELLSGFTRFVLDRALRIAAGWATQGVHVPISVNLASRSLLDRDLPAVVAGRLEAYGVRPDRLVLEITESVMTELAVAEEVISALKAQGVQVSVDDFGTGAASLTLLTKVPLDEVKIDRSFVANMVTSPEAAAIVRATVDLAHELGLRVVAEGVERADQRQALAALGVTAAQGFLFYPPLRLERATAVLQGLAQAATSPTIPIVRADVA
jgi:diguanylate cyclase (GGDEF)-like protein